MKQFTCKTKIISGAPAAEVLRSLTPGKLLMVSDPFFHQNGTAQQLAAQSGAAQIQIFSQITPDPTVELAAKGTALARQFQPDVLVALGGGSAMDCAKAMVYFSGLKATFVAIPTTSGSGSEVTDFAILTHNGVKHPLVDPKLRPDVAILDGALLERLPPSLVADGGFDVLSHALESYVARDACPITRALAGEAFSTAYALLPASWSGSLQARLPIHTAAAMAGMAFTQSGLGLCHAISHALGGAFHVAHGRLNAILLPQVLECNAHAAAEGYARLAAAAGISGSAQTLAVRNLKNALIRLRQQLGMPATLAQAGISPTQLRRQTGALVEAALADPCCAANPMTVEAFMVRGILDAVAGNG